MKILAIETSCDDTGVAILEVDERPKGYPDFKVLANLVSSQIEVHKKYGGVFPAMAKREHQKNLVPTLVASLKKSKLLVPGKQKLEKRKLEDINKILERETELKEKIIPFLGKYKRPDVDVIAITNGPGLEPCLWVGVNFAKALSYFWNIPIVPVNHIEGHILVNLLENKDIALPAIALVVSGGHTQIILVEKIGKYKILGETRDDAAGECFDKCAKILGLSYPGGPIISKLAEDADSTPSSIQLPRPMFNTKDYDFSFSGLKTAVLYAWQKLEKSDVFCDRKKHHFFLVAMAAEVQQAIIDVLVKKTMKAVKNYNVKTLILGGGVTANKELRRQFINTTNRLNTVEPIKLLFPPANLSTDNALMIATTGYFRAKQKKFTKWQNLKADSNLRIE